MYNFLLQIVIMAGLGVMIYLIARAAPRVGDDIAHDVKDHLSKLDKIFSHDKFEKFDVLFNNLVEKSLRKFKLLLMKLINLTNDYLNTVKKYKNNGGKTGPERPSLFERQSEGSTEEINVPEKMDDSNM
ncbi:MAG: hypothetical protein WC461_02660 [Candidatus Paceibacterota bacterium]